MSITAPRTRQPKGQPIGGQFAQETRGESATGLTAPPAEESAFRRRYDTMEQNMQAFHGELEKQVEDLADDENWNAYLRTMSQFHRYSLSNQLLIAVQSPGATRVAGFKKWQELGRQVRKGEKGIAIFVPKRIRVDRKDGEGKVLLGDNGKPLKDSITVGFTTGTVFDVSQTDGEELPDIVRELSETPPAGFKEDLQHAIQDAGFTVSYEDIPGGASGFTTVDGSNRVVIQTGLTRGSEAEVLAHELGHIKAGHIERHDQYHTGHAGHRGAMEVEAESIAYVLCRSNGMSTKVGEVSATYVAGWSRKEPEHIKESATKVSSVVRELLGNGSWRNAFADQS
ncbi:ArdC-like ssDNA-binding domain-containing protein [Agromyces subbeticus]|uniref:ArdC-like ssDNA-binding domain-containing protein n=1 Tax=Agromyces subbeticus TaxID=293890 RepID=UPI0003B51995|nr:ArdC-like ssDNA-binding domain-containing protein [Agromyces subbeticus]